MNKPFLFLGLLAGLCVSPVGAKVSRAELEQFANKADKVRVAQNIIIPAVFATYECTKKFETLKELGSTPTVLAMSANEVLKNPGMAVHAALESDASLPAALSDAIASAIFIQQPHLMLSIEKSNASSLAITVVKQMTFVGVLTRVVGDVCAVFIRNKMNKLIKEQYAGADAVIDRRIMRTLVFCATKVATHVLACSLSSLATQNAMNNARFLEGSPFVRPVEMFKVVDFNMFVLDTLIPTINYALAEIEGHVLAQQLVQAKQTVTA